LFFELRKPRRLAEPLTSIYRKPTHYAFDSRRRHFYHALGPTLLFFFALAEVRGRVDNHGDGSRRADRLLTVGDRPLWHSRYVGPQFVSFNSNPPLTTCFDITFGELALSHKHEVSREAATIDCWSMSNYDAFLRIRLYLQNDANCNLRSQ
jgi:hypothetical protein